MILSVEICVDAAVLPLAMTVHRDHQRLVGEIDIEFRLEDLLELAASYLVDELGEALTVGQLLERENARLCNVGKVSAHLG